MASTSFPCLKAHFSRSLAVQRGRLHLSAHSHHLWPDVSLAGHQQAWHDAATLWDDKWDRVFGEVIPCAQVHLAKHLELARPQNIAFAPNTHEFILRLLSALPSDRPPRILTTDSEFHSLTRQLARLQEDNLVVVDKVPTRPFETFSERFCSAAREPRDLVAFSQVFFNSGWAIPCLETIVSGIADSNTLIVIDGYHGFMARPTSLKRLQDRVFYMGGGYKYVMAGEGACFLYSPDGYASRPRNTGWFASFGTLSNRQDPIVSYGEAGARFLGATFDPSGLYRLNAVMNWCEAIGLNAAEIQARSLALQNAFIETLEPYQLHGFRASDLVVQWGSLQRGNFLAYDSPTAPEIHQRLKAAGIITDCRGTVLRIGFGLYHNVSEMPEIVKRIRSALR